MTEFSPYSLIKNTWSFFKKRKEHFHLRKSENCENDKEIQINIQQLPMISFWYISFHESGINYDQIDAFFILDYIIKIYSRC